MAENCLSHESNTRTLNITTYILVSLYLWAFSAVFFSLCTNVFDRYVIIPMSIEHNYYNLWKILLNTLLIDVFLKITNLFFYNIRTDVFGNTTTLSLLSLDLHHY